MKRRKFLKDAAITGTMTALAFHGLGKEATPQTEKINCLQPRDPSGHQFLFYSDSTSGQPGKPHEARHQKVIEMIKRLEHDPEFIAFPGDAVMTGSDERQWQHWLDVEMKWLKEKKYPLYQSTSNHHSLNPKSDELFRKYHPDIPQNGPKGLEGLAYYIREGNLLYVSTHQPIRSDYQGYDYMKDFSFSDTTWLDQVLEDNAEATYKLVVGHYPVFPVNGYLQAPQWCFKPEERAPFWNTLKKHRVDAYLCSHIIAFDVKVMDGILQICSGGAGTDFGPGGFMPGMTEYLHAAQVAIDKQGLRYQVLDTAGEIKESLSWPFPSSDPESWKQARELSLSTKEANHILLLQLKGRYIRPAPYQHSMELLTSEDGRFWLGIDFRSERLMLRLYLRDIGEQYWTGPAIDYAGPISLQLAFHPGMGPGGMLYRQDRQAHWSSMLSSSASGLETYEWPKYIQKEDENLQVAYDLVQLPSIWT